MAIFPTNPLPSGVPDAMSAAWTPDVLKALRDGTPLTVKHRVRVRRPRRGSLPEKTEVVPLALSSDSDTLSVSVFVRGEGWTPFDIHKSDFLLGPTPLARPKRRFPGLVRPKSSVAALDQRKKLREDYAKALEAAARTTRQPFKVCTVGPDGKSITNTVQPVDVVDGQIVVFKDRSTEPEIFDPATLIALPTDGFGERTSAAQDYKTGDYEQLQSGATPEPDSSPSPEPTGSTPPKSRHRGKALLGGTLAVTLAALAVLVQGQNVQESNPSDGAKKDPGDSAGRNPGRAQEPPPAPDVVVTDSEVNRREADLYDVPKTLPADVEELVEEGEFGKAADVVSRKYGDPQFTGDQTRQKVFGELKAADADKKIKRQMSKPLEKRVLTPDVYNSATNAQWVENLDAAKSGSAVNKWVHALEEGEIGPLRPDADEALVRAELKAEKIAAAARTRSTADTPQRGSGQGSRVYATPVEPKPLSTLPAPGDTSSHRGGADTVSNASYTTAPATVTTQKVVMQVPRGASKESTDAILAAYRTNTHFAAASNACEDEYRAALQRDDPLIAQEWREWSAAMLESQLEGTFKPPTMEQQVVQNQTFRAPNDYGVAV